MSVRGSLCLSSYSPGICGRSPVLVDVSLHNAQLSVDLRYNGILLWPRPQPRPHSLLQWNTCILHQYHLDVNHELRTRGIGPGKSRKVRLEIL